MKNKEKNKKLSFIEKFLYTITILLLVFSPVMSIFAKSALSKVNYEVESKKEDIEEEKKANESLQMKINELSSFDNLYEIAEKMNLSYTNSSVKVVE